MTCSSNVGLIIRCNITPCHSSKVSSEDKLSVVISERELTFTFAICCRPSVCLSGQDRKKVTKYISPIWGEAPTQAICVKNCVVGDLPDVITCAKFQSEIFRGYDFTGGRTYISIFLLIFEWALQQCSATALPVIVMDIRGGNRVSQISCILDSTRNKNFDREFGEL